MKKLVLFIVLFSLVGVVSAIRINEIELNPEGTDSGNEWIELYSGNEINLTGWKIMNKDNDEILLNQTFQNYLIINLESQWLDNSNESVSLFNGSSLVDSSIVINDSSNNNKTWQHCSWGWNFTETTKNSENSCEQEPDNPDDEPEDTEDAVIYLEIDWNDEDIVNGEEFEVEIKAFNLEDYLYNLKVWIEFKKNDTVISDRYDEEEDKWKSGKYYVDDFFKGPGNETEDIKLRIREDYKDFYDRAKIFFKIEGEDEEYEYIEILEKDEEPIVGDLNTSNNPKTLESTLVTGDVIKLGTPQVLEQTEDIKTQENIVYKSKTELIKKYAIYGFALLCVGICVLLSFKKLD